MICSTKKAKAYALPAFDGCSNGTVETHFKTAGNLFPGVDNKISLIGWDLDKSNYIELLIKESVDKLILKQKS